MQHLPHTSTCPQRPLHQGPSIPCPFLHSPFCLSALWAETTWRMLCFVSASFINVPAQFQKAGTHRTDQQTGSIRGRRVSTAVRFIHWPFAVKRWPGTAVCAACTFGYRGGQHTPHPYRYIHTTEASKQPTQNCVFILSACMSPEFWKPKLQTSSIVSGSSTVLVQHFLHWEF